MLPYGTWKQFQLGRVYRGYSLSAVPAIPFQRPLDHIVMHNFYGKAWDIRPVYEIFHNSGEFIALE